MKTDQLSDRFLTWRNNHINDRQLIMFLSVVIGLAVGLAAVTIKNLVHLIETNLSKLADVQSGYWYIVFPTIGILLTILFIKYINRNPVRHGIPGVLFAISKNWGKMKPHNLYSSIITSALTVGFGGSVGLEGPTVATGAAIGSNIGRLFGLNYKQVTLLLGCACAGAMAAIFKAPIAAIVFALEVIMLDLTMSAIVPLLLSSVTAVITSYLFLGQNHLYAFTVNEPFSLDHIWIYAVFGIFTGLVAFYFTKVYLFISASFEKIENSFTRLIIGGSLLGIMIFFIPSLYGEGYEEINSSLRGDYNFLFEHTQYANLEGNIVVTIILFLVVLLMKVVATSLTFGSGGIGGIFAPSLFSGAIAGLLFANVAQVSGYEISATNLAFVGMAGMIAAVIHAPLTSIFLIAELTKGYELFVPLMIVSTISYATTKIFVTNSVYTIQLAKRGELLTHHKDKALLMLMNVKELIETDFNIIRPKQTLGDLINVIKFAHRNIFPVVEEDGTFRGMIKLDDIRHIMFYNELYDDVLIRDLMFLPEFVIFTTDSMEEVAVKFQESGAYNIVVIDHGKYFGFISRAKLFSAYRDLLKDFSEH
ncbi:MAG: chloride channel protein [Bacteroidales bacterium]|nr:chloride channel protein [Bacteroidales bacterium]MBN2821103.1 chloride channel protein [Bacteroidales bacterium]